MDLRGELKGSVFQGGAEVGGGRKGEELPNMLEK